MEIIPEISIEIILAFSLVIWGMVLIMMGYCIYDPNKNTEKNVRWLFYSICCWVGSCSTFLGIGLVTFITLSWYL